MRVTVGMILGNLGAGVSVDELLADYPYLEREDVLESVRYARWCMEYLAEQTSEVSPLL